MEENKKEDKKENENNNNPTNEKTNKKEYRLNLSSLIAIIILSVVIAVAVVLAIVYIYQDNKKDNKNSKIDSYLENSEDFLSTEIDEDDIEYYDDEYDEDEYDDEDYNEITYDYDDYVNSTDYTDDVTVGSEDEYNFSLDDYQTWTEIAVDFLYNLEANPFYEITSLMNGYEAIKNVGEKGQDGSYVINMNFEDLVDNLWSEGLNPSTLKTMDILKNNISVLSETQISLKDTGVSNEYYVTMMSLEENSDNEYEGYAIVEEYDEDDNVVSTKYLDVKVTYDSNYLINNLTYTEVSKETVPSDLVEEYTFDNYSYSYSDYIN